MPVLDPSPAPEPAVKLCEKGERCASKPKMRGSLSDNAVVDLARRGDSSSEGGRSEVEGDGPAWNANAASDVAKADHLTDVDDAARCGVDEVILGALKKYKFNQKIKEIEQVVRGFVLDGDKKELVFDIELTETTFERLLAHRVAQHWGLETRVLEDRETIVGTWPAGRARVGPAVELGSLQVVIEGPDCDDREGGRGRGRRRVGGRGDGRMDAMRGGLGGYDEQQRQYYYHQMMYQHQQMVMYQMMHQQGMGGGMVHSGVPSVQANAYSGSPSPSHGSLEGSEHPSPTRQMSGSPASPAGSASNGRMMGGAESPGMPMGNSPMYPPVYGGYGGPPMMMGGSMPPYGIPLPVVPIMLPDGRIVYQQQPIQPVAVPPPPPPPIAPGPNASGR